MKSTKQETKEKTYANEIFDNAEGYIRSPNFEKYVHSIARMLFINDNSDMFNDILQECAIAVIESFNTFDPQKCGGFSFFWGHAYKRMYEYAKKEMNKQINVVHIPIHRTNAAFGNEKRKYAYEQVKHTYVRGLMYDRVSDHQTDQDNLDENVYPFNNRTSLNTTVRGVEKGRDKTLFDDYQISLNSDSDAVIDIAEAFNKLPKEYQTVVGMRIGSIPTNDGNDSYDSIARTLGISKRRAQYLYNKGRDMMREELSCYNANT